MNYIIYDLEATCWENMPIGYVQETIEIGAYRFNEYGQLRGKFSRFIKPVVHPVLSLFCRELTGISQEDVNRADTFPVVIEEFMDWARVDTGDYILCSWGSFDRKMLAADCKLHRLDDDWTDLHTNLKEQYRVMHGKRHGIGLKKAVESEGLVFTGQHHRGISDAENLAKLFLRYLDRWNL